MHSLNQWIVGVKTAAKEAYCARDYTPCSLHTRDYNIYHYGGCCIQKHLNREKLCNYEYNGIHR